MRAPVATSFVDDFHCTGRGTVSYLPQSYELLRRNTERKRQKELEELASPKKRKGDDSLDGCEAGEQGRGAVASAANRAWRYNAADRVPFGMYIGDITAGRDAITSAANTPSKSGKARSSSAAPHRPPLQDVERAIIARVQEVQAINAAYSLSGDCPAAGSGLPEEEITALLGTRTKEEVLAYLAPTSAAGDVHVVASDEEGDEGSADEEKGAAGGNGGFRRKQKRKKPAKVKTSSATKNQLLKEFQPCDHDGPCTMAVCSCLRNGSFCEKFCACPVDCKHKFQGCRCRGGCTSKACPCFAASRNCDPDLCGTCGASIHPLYLPTVEAHMQKCRGAEPVLCREVSAFTGASEEEENGEGSGAAFKVCSNTMLLQLRRKRIMMARSKIHGWGSFLTERAEKNEFITEYVGEVITQDEADRRGKVYDKQDCSFLFSLNEEQVVDATRKGNKSKFLNHSLSNANCVTKVMQVNGDHKIGMFASKTIEAGEELTFNYGNLFDSAPKWNNSRKEKLKLMNG